jgi:hypothetical protein
VSFQLWSKCITLRRVRSVPGVAGWAMMSGARERVKQTRRRAVWLDRVITRRRTIANDALPLDHAITRRRMMRRGR